MLDIMLLQYINAKDMFGVVNTKSHDHICPPQFIIQVSMSHCIKGKVYLADIFNSYNRSGLKKLALCGLY